MKDDALLAQQLAEMANLVRKIEIPTAILNPWKSILNTISKKFTIFEAIKTGSVLAAARRKGHEVTWMMFCW